MKLLTLNIANNSLFNIRNNIYFLIGFICLNAFSANSFAESEITLPDNAVYIDVRTWVEHKVDHIEGDTRIHVSDIVEGVTEQFPAKDTPIRLYCRSGVRSSRALDKLKAKGYLDVQNLGGIKDARKLRGIKP